MPITCPVCGSEDFDRESGLYFCSECGTQSQQFVEEEVHDWLGDEEREREAATKLGKQIEDKKESPSETIRPWALTEGLTILLRHQVDSLIQRGASPELKDVAFRLWAAYLKRIGQGFGDTSHRDRAKFSRLHFTPTFDKPISAQTLLIGRKLKSRKKKQLTVDELQAMHTMFGGETFYEDEDNPFIDCEADMDELDMYAQEREEWEKEVQSKHNVKLNTYYTIMKNSGFLIVLHVTLSICYIGLQYTNSLVTLFDLLKAVYSGQLPYSEAPLLFPPDMKLEGKDWLFFCRPSPPCVDKFSQTTKSVSLLLDVLPLPPPDMKLLTLRFLTDMNLPVELHAIIRNLLMTSHPRFDKLGSWLPKSEPLAMAYVVVATKLVFGLNDHIEEKISEFTHAVNEIIGARPGIHLFDWKDWSDEQCQLKSKSFILPNNWREVRTALDTDPYCKESRKYCNLKSDNLIKSYFVVKNHKKITATFRQMCSKLEKLNLFLASCETKQPTRTTENDDTSGQDGQMDCSEDLFQSMESQGSQQERSASSSGSSHRRGKDFTQHSVMHLVNWENFVDQVLESLSAQSDTPSRPLGKDPQADSLYERLEQVSEQCVHAWTEYAIYHTGCHLKHCHKSYVHILEVAESITGYKKAVLHSFVQSLELIYFLQDHELSAKRRSNFKHMYF